MIESKLTSLGDDGSGGDNDDGPVELSFEVGNNLITDLAEGDEGAVGDLDEEGLAARAVLLFVFNQFCAVEVDLA